MALLKSIDNVPGLNYYDYRDNTYYNKYEYRLRIDIPGLRYTLWCTEPEHLDAKISGKTYKYGKMPKKDIPVVTANLDALKAVIVLQRDRKKNKTLGVRIESETIAVFSNDLTELQAVQAAIGSAGETDYTQVQTAAFAGTKYFVNDPPHKFRVYFRSKRVEEEFHLDLRKTLERQKELYPSNALQHWCSKDAKTYGMWYFRWTNAAHFIDYDDESTLSYLALVHGDILGKKYKLEKRPEPI